MAAIPIGIDLCHNPLRVSRKFTDLVIVQEGSKGANFDVGGGQEKPHEGWTYETRVVGEEAGKGNTAPANINDSQELVDCFKDACDVAKSHFGSSNIKSAVVVVPNATDDDTRRSIEAAGNTAFIHDLQVIPEHIAVAAAYADKTKPAKTSRITIISCTSGECDAYVVTVSHNSGMNYAYKVGNEESYFGEIDHGEKKSDTFFNSMWGNNRYAEFCKSHWNVDKLANVVSSSADNLDIPAKEKLGSEKVVFVGKSPELEKIREIISRGFAQIKEWKEFEEDSEQLAAYGAAVLAWLGEPIIIREKI